MFELGDDSTAAAAVLRRAGSVNEVTVELRTDRAPYKLLEALCDSG